MAVFMAKINKILINSQLEAVKSDIQLTQDLTQVLCIKFKRAAGLHFEVGHKVNLQRYRKRNHVCANPVEINMIKKYLTGAVVAVGMMVGASAANAASMNFGTGNGASGSNAYTFTDSGVPLLQHL